MKLAKGFAPRGQRSLLCRVMRARNETGHRRRGSTSSWRWSFRQSRSTVA